MLVLRAVTCFLLACMLVFPTQAEDSRLPAAAPTIECGETQIRGLYWASPEPYRMGLGAGDIVRRPLEITTSGVRLRCHGARLNHPGPDSDALLVQIDLSSPDTPPRDVVVEGCAISGAVLIFGLGRNGEAPRVRSISRRPGHTQRLQSASPSRIIRFERLLLVESDSIPFCGEPSVDGVSLSDTRIEEENRSTAVCLDAESAGNRMLQNPFATSVRHELVAVNGSARNVIFGNMFAGVASGEICLHRNCGEGGTLRHQPRRRNVIRNNVFRHGWMPSLMNLFGRPSPAIWIGSRMGKGSCSDEGDGFPFGSSADNAERTTSWPATCFWDAESGRRSVSPKNPTLFSEPSFGED